MLVVCVEGSHGCGKTELCAQFQRAGYCVLDEAFLDMPDYVLHPQSLLMETSWVVSWFLRLLKKASEVSATADGREPVYIADRSPFSAVFYAAHGSLLEPIIRHQLEEVARHAGILVFTVYLQVERETLWSRIQDRLGREPGRVKYNEDKREWMEQTLEFYETFRWDMTVNNTDISIPALLDEVVCALSARSDRFRRSVTPITEAATSSEDDTPPSPPTVSSALPGVGHLTDLSPTRPLTDDRRDTEIAKRMDPMSLHTSRLAAAT